jgi:hypothetical protein
MRIVPSSSQLYRTQCNGQPQFSNPSYNSRRTQFQKIQIYPMTDLLTVDQGLAQLQHHWPHLPEAEVFWHRFTRACLRRGQVLFDSVDLACCAFHAGVMSYNILVDLSPQGWQHYNDVLLPTLNISKKEVLPRLLDHFATLLGRTCDLATLAMFETATELLEEGVAIGEVVACMCFLLMQFPKTGPKRVHTLNLLAQCVGHRICLSSLCLRFQSCFQTVYVF